ncbi:MAG: SOS response-associated peptidase family protein [Enterococcus lacertideformus]|uniref:Abasic site processing protein n=1 Tax=Enterococcus lacertideformus TaxID=2771493 RepID=A0A931AUX5_9ENTE|nr:SOS response-associated peptidase family protein [Enterococcus lacertideformus]
MCGHYFFDLASDELKKYYEQVIPQAESRQIHIGKNEIYPSNYVVTLGLNQEADIVPSITRWGFTSFKKGQLVINARAETIEEKNTFSHPFKETRCVFPMSCFYEWDSDKQKVMFTDSHSTVLYVSGFYRIHKNEAGFETESIILTTQPSQSVLPVHDRMPLILAKEQIKDWVTDLDFARNQLSATMPELNRRNVD